jgi:serine protease inhibitor
MHGIARTLVFALVFLSCSASAPAAAGDGIAASYDRFGFSLLHRLADAEPGKNVVISPASVAIALAMTANAAAGKTRDQILTTLGVGGGDAAAFDAANARLLDALHHPGDDLQFSVANALWLNPHLPLQPEFARVNRSVFDATVQIVEFGDPSAADTINAWVKRQTNGLIPTIVDSTDPLDAAILTNAIATKAKWLVPFEKSATRDAPFHDGAVSTTVSMMGREGSFAYAHHAGWQIARLPYRGDRFAMYVLLPDSGTRLADALRKLDAAAFDAAAGALREQPLWFAMPRYTAAYKARLNEPLAALGMALPFETGADFSGLVRPPQRARISGVNHRVFVRVDEDGTEAAAATSVEIQTLSVRMPPSTKMIVDRPFLMVIRDDRSKQILFAGAIYEPLG